MNKLLSVAGFGFALAMMNGCAASPGLPGGYDVQIDSSFTDSDVSVIEASMSFWEQYKDGPQFTYHVVSAKDLPSDDNVPWNSIVIRNSSLDEIRSKGGDPKLLALTWHEGELDSIINGEGTSGDSVGATIMLPPSDATNNLHKYQITIMHEAGHAMGLNHTGKGTIMNPSMNGVAESPTCTDLQHYCSLRHTSCTCD